MTHTAPAPLLELKHICKTFNDTMSWRGRSSKGVQAVDDATLSLYPNETLGLVGETGSGKSTLGRIALRLIEPSSGCVRFEGQDITHLSARLMREKRQRMQMVFQDPYGSLDPRMSVDKLVSEPLIVHNIPAVQRQEKMHAALRQVGLDPSLAHRYPHEFSGGQRQRIGIARAMVLDPTLLVLDEPVSALDVSIQAQVLNLLHEIQARTRVSYLFIAHDLSVVRHISHRVAVMYLGRIVEIGTRDAIYTRPKHPYTVSLLSAVPIPDPDTERTRKRIPLIGEIGSANNTPSGCRFHPRCPRAREIAQQPHIAKQKVGVVDIPVLCATQDPALLGSDQEHACACHFPHDTL
jgi:oligopeptide transport system ATP-binding protein